MKENLFLVRMDLVKERMMFLMEDCMEERERLVIL